MHRTVGRYGLPTEVEFCKKCTMNNQRPASTVEFRNQPGEKKTALSFDAEGVCDACRFSEKKANIDWHEREDMLRDLCDRFRREDGRYDVVIPGSGGKDSVMAAHVLKFEYGMNPLLVTWPPALYTDVGKRNYDSWLRPGFASMVFKPNPRLHSLLTRLAFTELCHPFQPFILGQKNLAPKISVDLDIPLVIYGENEAEYGNPLGENEKPTRDAKYYSYENRLDDIYLGGQNARQIVEEHGISVADLQPYLPVDPFRIEATGTEVHYLGYYLNWHPQETYYYAVENSEFVPNDERTEGSYSKYSSIDDKVDWLHYYTIYIKFGIGRATYDTAQEIRNGDITREEGIALVRRFDGEFPEKYLDDCLRYMGLSRERFHEVIESFRTPHLWKRSGGEWVLRDPIWGS